MTQAVPRTVAGDRRAPSRGDQQRALIIEAVVDLLRTVPIADLSVSQIAKHAGVTRPAFYFYFETKYTVVAAALEQVWHEIEGATRGLDSFDFSETPEEFSGRMVDNALAVWRANLSLINACAQAKASDQQLSRMWDGFVGSLSGRLTEFSKSIRATGRIEPVSDDIAALVSALVAMTLAVLLDQPTGIPTDRMIEAVKAVWLGSIWRETSPGSGSATAK